jgi:predicted transcriptional regulator
MTKRKHRRFVSGRRDLKLIQYLVLKCIDESAEDGVKGRDIIYRCELNYYYLNHVIDTLLEIEAVYTVNKLDSNRNYTTYFLTEKGHNIYKALEQELAGLGIRPELNNARV